MNQTKIELTPLAVLRPMKTRASLGSSSMSLTGQPYWDWIAVPMLLFSSGQINSTILKMWGAAW